MLGKKLLWLILAAGFLSSNGCCAFWERVCERRQPQCYQPAPCTCAPAPAACPPNPCYSPPPGTAVPVPNTPGWQR
jgi:hypothetical protein